MMAPVCDWLMKTEPSTFSLDDLVASPEQTTMWEGVRNYTVRNWMRDDMAVGDEVLFYHSSCAVPGVVGLAEITRAAYPDPPSSTRPATTSTPSPTRPTPAGWWSTSASCGASERTITLAELKAHAEELDDFLLVRRGQPALGHAGHRRPVDGDPRPSRAPR